MGNKNPIIDLFQSITDGIRVINCDVFNKDGLEFIYFNKEKEWIFFQDAKNDIFWVNYSRYWSPFKSEFNLEYEEIQALTKFLVDEALKREVTTPGMAIWFQEKVVDEALKREVTTPYILSNSNGSTEVEKALKREIE